MIQRSQRPSIARAGLSLFELLLSLALLAAIATALAASMGLALRIQDRTGGLDQYSEPFAGRVMLRRWVASAVPPAFLTPFPAPFRGDPDRLVFTTLAPVGFAPDTAALRVEIMQDGDTLLMRFQGLDDAGETLSEGQTILAENARGLQFAYFDTESAPPAWREDWPDTAATLPAALRITLNAGSNPAWPEFVVRPRLLSGL